jgi:hypothetical protein
MFRKPRICCPGISGCASGDFGRKGVRRLADDLQIALDGILGHVDESRFVTVEGADIAWHLAIASRMSLRAPTEGGSQVDRFGERQI